MAAVSLSVSNGLFNILLGDTTVPNMYQPLSASVFGGSDRFLRVWFSSDNVTFAQLSPDRRIAAVPYALQAEGANTAATASNADTLDAKHAADLTYTAGTGLTLSSNQFSVDTTAIQQRVSGTCASGSAIRVINANGTVTCEQAGSDWSLTGNSGTAPPTNFLGTSDAQPLVVKTNSAEALRVTSTGQVGIGLTSPETKLDVNGAIRTSTQFISTLGTGTAPLWVGSSSWVANLNADLLDGQHGAYYQNAANLNAGTLSTSRYSAQTDLSAEGYLGDAVGDLAQNNGARQDTLNADLLDGQHGAYFQARVSSACAAGSSIRQIAADGTVTCETDDNTTYAAGNQLSLSGTTFNVTEGTGSGLDADTLDGWHGDDYRTYIVINASNANISLDSTCRNHEGVSITITAPGSGWVVIEANVTVILNHNSGTEDRLFLAIDDEAAVCEDTYDMVLWTIPASYPDTGPSYYTFTVRSATWVNTGTHTYYLNSRMTSGAGDDLVLRATMYATYLFYPE